MLMALDERLLPRPVTGRMFFPWVFWFVGIFPKIANP